MDGKCSNKLYMYKQYFKQAWHLLRQEKLFSTIYILGTGLSISMVMVLAIVFYVKIANIYPETNRDRTLFMRVGGTITADGSESSSRLSLDMIRTTMGDLKTAEIVTVVYAERCGGEVQMAGTNENLPVTVRYVDENFWKVFNFNFRDGKPFSEADRQSGIQTAVIAESLAVRLFRTTEVTGRSVMFNFRPYRIAGVVKDPSFVADKTYALLWIPWSADKSLSDPWGDPSYTGGALGRFQACILCPSVSKMEDVKTEIDANVQRYASTMTNGLVFSVNGQPDRQWQTIFRCCGGDTVDWNQILFYYALIFLIFLLVPAVSLSGMTDSRMERRLAEMGVRRAFGAPARKLMTQVVVENFVFTLLGGTVGLMFSWLLLLFSRNWILQIGQVFADVPPDGVDVSFSPSMLMNYTVFFIAFLICLVLNILAAIIPAWRSSHRAIIYSLNVK